MSAGCSVVVAAANAAAAAASFLQLSLHQCVIAFRLYLTAPHRLYTCGRVQLIPSSCMTACQSVSYCLELAALQTSAKATQVRDLESKSEAG